jgi:hypothetical protein
MTPEQVILSQIPAYTKTIENIIDDFNNIYTTEYVNSMDIVNLISLQGVLADNVSRLTNLADSLNKHVLNNRKHVIPGKMIDSGVRNMSIKDVGRVHLESSHYVSIKDGNDIEAFTWLDDIGLGDVVKTTVNASTLKSRINQRLKNGEDVPEDIFKLTPYTEARISFIKK